MNDNQGPPGTIDNQGPAGIGNNQGPLRTVQVTRYVTPLRKGGSLPAIAEAAITRATTTAFTCAPRTRSGP